MVFITAHDDPATQQGLRKAPGVPCLRKPFDEALLFEAIGIQGHLQELYGVEQSRNPSGKPTAAAPGCIDYSVVIPEYSMYRLVHESAVQRS